MKSLFAVLVCLPLAVGAQKITPLDLDFDDVPDWNECALEDDGLTCSERVDNCLGVKNTNQYVSPNYIGDADKAHGTACDYDIDGDGMPATVADYFRLVNSVNLYQINCQPYADGTLPIMGGCDPALNYVGDLTGGLTFFSLEITTDGRLTYDDLCVLLARNPLLKVQIDLPIDTSCQKYFVHYGL